jgi:RHS repeat-associated protein
MNQYSATPFGGRTNDANGNLTIAASEYFIYDYRNQLVAAYHYTGTGFNQTFAAKYDCFGRRVEKIGATTTNRYYYIGRQEIEEQDATNATVATYVLGNGIDELLTTDRGGQRSFFHADGLGSIRKVTDNSGAIVEQYRYDDYGQPTFLNAAGTVIPATQITNATLFTGRRYDAETGFYYFRSRCLDPAAGRFITRDRIGLWGDAANFGNPYSFVGNNPLSHNDPLGLCPSGGCWGWVDGTSNPPPTPQGPCGTAAPNETFKRCFMDSSWTFGPFCNCQFETASTGYIRDFLCADKCCSPQGGNQGGGWTDWNDSHWGHLPSMGWHDASEDVFWDILSGTGGASSGAGVPTKHQGTKYTDYAGIAIKQQGIKYTDYAGIAIKQQGIK